jgi:hypothetical protein
MTKTPHITSHARLRMAQRGISEKELSLCLYVGESFHRTGAVFYVMTEKILQKISHISSSVNDKMNGMTAVVTYHGNVPVINTVYKNPQAPRLIRKKMKRNAKKGYV